MVRMTSLKRGTALGLTAIVAALSGCGPLPPEAVQQLQQGQQHYKAGKYAEAVKVLDRFLAGWGATEAAAEAYYIRGQSYLKLDQPKRCRADLERALTQCKRPDLCARIHVALGSMDWEAGRTSSAVDHYRQALPDLADRPPKDIVLYRLGVGLQQAGEWSQARRHFAELVGGYPTSPVITAARLRFSWTYDYFTIQVGAYSSGGSAAKEVERLRKAGLEAEKQLDARSGRPLHAVRVGRYPTYAEAERELARVRRVAGDAIIVP
jgi:tetratricopeptide (TPR) repeat protein